MLLLVLLSVLAGCLDPMGPPDDGEGPPGDKAGHRLDIVWDRPVIINETVMDDGFTVQVGRENEASECDFQEYGTKGSYFTYDRDGRTASGFYEMGPDERSQRFAVPLDGEPPFLFIADWSACLDSDATYAFNVSSGYEVWTGDRTLRIARTVVNVTVPPGETAATVDWTPGRFDYRLSLALPDTRNRTGASYGTISIQDARGTELCQDTYTPMDHTVDCVPYYFYPGPYQIRVNLTRPAARETTWPYIIETVRFHDGVCEFGFRWEGLCR